MVTTDNENQLLHLKMEVNKNSRLMTSFLRKYMEPCFAFGSTNAFPVMLFRHVGSRVSKPHGYPGYIVCFGCGI